MLRQTHQYHLNQPKLKYVLSQTIPFIIQQIINGNIQTFEALQARFHPSIISLIEQNIPKIVNNNKSLTLPPSIGDYDVWKAIEQTYAVNGTGNALENLRKAVEFLRSFFKNKTPEWCEKNKKTLNELNLKQDFGINPEALIVNFDLYQAYKDINREKIKVHDGTAAISAVDNEIKELSNIDATDKLFHALGVVYYYNYSNKDGPKLAIDLVNNATSPHQLVQYTQLDSIVAAFDVLYRCEQDHNGKTRYIFEAFDTDFKLDNYQSNLDLGPIITLLKKEGCIIPDTCLIFTQNLDVDRNMRELYSAAETKINKNKEVSLRKLEDRAPNSLYNNEEENENDPEEKVITSAAEKLLENYENLWLKVYASPLSKSAKTYAEYKTNSKFEHCQGISNLEVVKFIYDLVNVKKTNDQNKKILNSIDIYQISALLAFNGVLIQCVTLKDLEDFINFVVLHQRIIENKTGNIQDESTIVFVDDGNNIDESKKSVSVQNYINFQEVFLKKELFNSNMIYDPLAYKLIGDFELWRAKQYRENYIHFIATHSNNQKPENDGQQSLIGQGEENQKKAAEKNLDYHISALRNDLDSITENVFFNRIGAQKAKEMASLAFSFRGALQQIPLKENKEAMPKQQPTYIKAMKDYGDQLDKYQGSQVTVATGLKVVSAFIACTVLFASLGYALYCTFRDKAKEKDKKQRLNLVNPILSAEVKQAAEATNATSTTISIISSV